MASQKQIRKESLIKVHHILNNEESKSDNVEEALKIVTQLLSADGVYMFRKGRGIKND